jgi:small nuclear ribonucleoprotein D3
MTSTIGIPIKLLNEAQGHVVTLEITSGYIYRGKLLEGEADDLSRTSCYIGIG